MSRGTKWFFAVAFVAAGCETPATFETIATLHFAAATGVAEEIALSLDDEGPALLRVTLDEPDPLTCVQLDSVTADDAVWISNRDRDDWGPYCTTCSERAFVGHGYGLFSVPNSGAVVSAHVLRVLAALRDCEALVPLDRLSAPRVGRLERWRARRGPIASGRLGLRFYFVEGGQVEGEGALQDPLLVDAIREIRARFAEVGVDVDVEHGGTFAPLGTDPTRFADDDRGALRALSSHAQGGAPYDAVPVIFTPCLLSKDLVNGGDRAVDGYAPNIPGGFAPQGIEDAVFVRFGACDALQAKAYWPTGASLGRVTAHELGHYLGLYHAVESDGGADHLDDTDGDNIMYFRALQSEGGFSPTQGAVMRTHPLVKAR